METVFLKLITLENRSLQGSINLMAETPREVFLVDDLETLSLNQKELVKARNHTCDVYKPEACMPF